MSPEDKELVAKLDIEIKENERNIQFEDKKFKDWKVRNNSTEIIKKKTENIRRRHNYVPFLVNLLKVLAEKNELIPLLEKAKEKQKNKKKNNQKQDKMVE
jgi:ubiquitin carboxyl-terminal hydrolase L5